MNSHQKRAEKLCLFCLGNAKTLAKFKFHMNIYQLLPNYDAAFYTSVICKACSKVFKFFIENDNEEAKKKLATKIKSKDHEKLKCHRSSIAEDCTCYFCMIVKSWFKVSKETNQPTRKYISKHSTQRLCGNCSTDGKKLFY